MRLEDRMHAFLPSGVEISGYKFHRFTFRSNPLTAKKRS